MAVSFHVNPEYARIDRVVGNLYLSGVTALSPSILEEHEITYIINATTEVPNLRSLSHIPRRKLWLDDTCDSYILPHLEEQTTQIAHLLSDGHHVLVHCVAGVSRSASIVLAYLTKYHSASLREAYHLLAAIRPMVRPNLGFWRQLVTFEEMTKGRPSSVRLVIDPSQEESLLPDVYLPEAMDGEMRSGPLSERRSSGGKSKFRPVLATLPEIVDAAA